MRAGGSPPHRRPRGSARAGSRETARPRSRGGGTLAPARSRSVRRRSPPAIAAARSGEYGLVREETRLRETGDRWMRGAGAGRDDGAPKAQRRAANGDRVGTGETALREEHVG